MFSRADIVNALQLGNNELELGPTEYAFEFRAGAFQRMGYSGDLSKNQWAKSYLYGQWRYLMHVMIVSISARRSEFDVIGPRLQSAMAALVYNKAFSFSQMFMEEFIQQIHTGGRERFLLYPRFLMMIIQYMLPNLPVLHNLVQVSAIDCRFYTDCVHHNVRRPIEERPLETALFGHIVNPNYVPPPNNQFLDDDFFGQQQQPQPQQDDPLEQQAMLNDVFIQMEDPQADHGVQIDEEVAETLVQEVLEPVQPVRESPPIDQDLNDIDAYVEEVVRDPEVGEGSGVHDKGKEVVLDSSDEDDDEEGDDKDDDENKDDDDSDDDNSPNYSEVNKKFERVRSRLVLIGSGSRKRSRDEDSNFSLEEEESDQE